MGARASVCRQTAPRQRRVDGAHASGRVACAVRGPGFCARRETGSRSDGGVLRGRRGVACTSGVLGLLLGVGWRTLHSSHKPMACAWRWPLLPTRRANPAPLKSFGGEFCTPDFWQRLLLDACCALQPVQHGQTTGRLGPGARSDQKWRAAHGHRPG